MARCRRPTIKIETGKKLQPALKWRDPRKSTNSVTPRVKSNVDRENRNMSSRPLLRSVTAPTPSCAHTSTHVFPGDVSDKQLTIDKKNLRHHVHQERQHNRPHDNKTRQRLHQRPPSQPKREEGKGHKEAIQRYTWHATHDMSFMR